MLTGDSLFVNSAGRPDLLGSGQEKKLAERQFHTLRDFYLKLADGVTIYPAHGARFAVRLRTSATGSAARLVMSGALMHSSNFKI